MKNVAASQPKVTWHHVILAMSVFLGSILRIFPGTMTGFPLNDGGMLYIMIRDLRFNHYILPAVTTYNNSGIPFAYPPLGFYLTGFLEDAMCLPALESLRWLPVAASIFSIFAFYLLASTLLRDRTRGAVASMIYALAPGGYDWYIMGGGLTRALGILFLLLSLYFLLRSFQIGGWKNVLSASLFCSLAVLSHPEYGLHTAASCLLFWIFYRRTRAGTLRAALIGLLTIILTSPWWGTLLAQHGIDPVLSAFHTGMYHRNPLISLAGVIFGWGSFLPFLLVFRLLGIGWAIWRRNFLLLSWMALPYFVEPRSAPAVTSLPIFMLTALGLTDALPWLLDNWRRTRNPEAEAKPLPETRWFNAIVFFLLLSLFVESALFSFRLINTTLKSPALDAFAWIKENSPESAHFVIITGTPDAMVDPMQEWFPALAQRHSQTTLQGLEWTLAEGFVPRLKILGELQACETATCIENWSETSGLDFSHLLVEKKYASKSLLESFSAADYELLYENSEYLLYQK